MHVYLFVHLCSLDSVAAQCLASEWRTLRDALVDAISQEPAELPIVVLDQRWLPPTSSAHANVRAALEARPNTLWVHHDESAHGWDAIGAQLAALLAQHGITTVTLIGAWLGDEPGEGPNEWGCVNQTRRILIAHGVEVDIDPDLCGLAEWLS